MKKIGILYGEENLFPSLFIERVNEMAKGQFIAEPVWIDKVILGEEPDYALIVDRISHDVPFYRSFLKYAAISGVIVLNNPFRLSQNDRFFKASVAKRLDIPLSHLALLPSHHRPKNTVAESFRNLQLPYNWDALFSQIPFPNNMKSYSDSGTTSDSWVDKFQLFSSEDLFHMHRLTGQEVMMLEEKRDFESYFRVYCVDGMQTLAVPFQLQDGHSYSVVAEPIPKNIQSTLIDQTTQLNQTLGYDFSTVDFAFHQGSLFVIDVCHPVPDLALEGLTDEQKDWIVTAIAKLAISKASLEKEDLAHLSWGQIMEKSISPSSNPPAQPVAEVPLATDPIKKDNLKKIEGIGPKIEALLNQSGIYTFQQLSLATHEFLLNILHNAGSRYRMHDPKSWPKQAKLAYSNQWQELEVLQLALKGGREE